MTALETVELVVDHAFQARGSKHSSLVETSTIIKALDALNLAKGKARDELRNFSKTFDIDASRSFQGRIGLDPAIFNICLFVTSLLQASHYDD